MTDAETGNVTRTIAIWENSGAAWNMGSDVNRVPLSSLQGVHSRAQL
ncbi:hypothetical protein [Cupriavidus pauculus]|nr:hypothetical protein [Cupriavidus pauculus]GJG98385.1 hypothetical protein CBA19C6_27870 [Cupriavidus pauculus]